MLSPQGKIVSATREKAVDDPADIDVAFTNKAHGEAAVSFTLEEGPFTGFFRFYFNEQRYNEPES